MLKKPLHCLLASLMLFAAATRLSAEQLPEPKSRTVLTVRGDLARTNGVGVARLDMAMLNSLPQRVIRTSTPWYPGISEFSGPLLSDVLAFLGASGKEIRASALNDYSVTIPSSDASNHEVVLATLLNGKPMSIRDKGPIFIVYPFDSKPELRSATYYERAIWQLKSIEVK